MLGAALLLAAALPVESPRAERVSLTVYRAPYRTARQPMTLSYLGGFALVTETRTVQLPAGEAVLRFEGVADGIVPASAIVIGLPGGVIEKNRDARLLSPAALVDGTLGRAVILRRTDRKSGKVSEEPATIIAGPGAGVVVQTPRGFETLGCSGLGEHVGYNGVPAGLSAKPVLSVTTNSPQAITATVTLSYLASGFDWSASYVATVADDGKSLDLFAWLTLANSNGQSFPDAQVQAVAGRLERRHEREIMAAASKLELHCYPLGTTTSDLPTIEPYRQPVRERDESLEIIVTAQRRNAPPMMAAAAPPPPAPPPPPEDLGDLKLYRVPEAVTVSPNAQKQVALLARDKVQFERVYRMQLQSWQLGADFPALIVLRMRNDKKSGLGLALPAGTTTLYRPSGEERLLLGLGTLADTAEGEKTKLTAGISRQIVAAQTGERRQRRVELTNANPYPVTVEVAIGGAGERAFKDASAPLERIDGIQTWRAKVPANGTAMLSYVVPTS